MNPGPAEKAAPRRNRILESLRRPLVLAARNDFAALPRMSGLGARILNLMLPLERLPLGRTDKDRLARLKAAMTDFPTSDIEEDRRRVLTALAVLDRLPGDLEFERSEVEKKSTPSEPTISETPAAPESREFPDRRPLWMSVQYVKGVGPRAAELLAARNIVTVEDLLYFLPRRYEDLRRVGRIADLVVGEFGQATGEIVAMSDPAARFGRKPFEVRVQDESGQAGLLWFHYGAQSIPKRFKVGDRVRFGGKVGLFRNQRQIAHPDIEPAAEPDGEDFEGNEVDSRKIRPVYPDIPGIPKKRMAAIVQNAVERYASLLEDPLPAAIRKNADLPELAQALRFLHLPDEDANTDRLNDFSTQAQQRLAFDELFFVQLALARKRHDTQTEPGYAHRRLNTLARRFTRRFPHKLTDAQVRVVREIVADLENEKPMNRLLQGDVGSGKTAVAILTALMVIENGCQVALMAPTEILAEQHYRTIRELCDFEGLRVELLTSDIARTDKLAIYEGLAAGTIDWVIGTHALIQKGVEFKKLGYAIVDEQHRFGVRQRVMLAKKGRRPDALVMTATPIPRSLSLVLYGDLDVSVLDELPKGRRPVKTDVLWMSEWKRAEALLLDELRQGRQAYVITPLVAESETLDLADAESEHERLQTVLDGHTVGLLHGRMTAVDKERVMRAFLEGVYDVLVSTTVVEVGVDVPNATVMIILHAERFGLSQLHQLRGRVGRDRFGGRCLLLCEKVGEDARERLSIMEETTDGFRIAEKDLEIRGPGDFLGTRQVGEPLLVHANLIRDAKLLETARKLALQCLSEDPELQRQENEPLLSLLNDKWRERLSLLGIG